jgi:CRISPR-associated protein Cas1
MLLEEALGEPIEEGRVRYHSSEVTVRVAVTPKARDEVRAAVERSRWLRAQATRPPHSVNAKLCLRCSLAPVCLPEEEQLGTDPEWAAVRLFPPRRQAWPSAILVQQLSGGSGDFPELHEFEVSPVAFADTA